MTLAIGILVIFVIALIVYNYQLNRKIKTFKNMNDRINNLSVVQDFMNIVGNRLTVDEKIQKINDILIEKYEIKYSTIVVFDGAEYIIKASNVDKRYWDSLKSLQDIELFKDSISTATPKYVTINNEGERLPYQNMDIVRAKSAIFFPLYIDNVYIGYWIIESEEPHKFDNIDITILDVIKDNIVTVLKNVVHQQTLETIVRTDQFTGLKSEAYLYGDGKKVIDNYTISTVCMFKITNIVDINKRFSRELGNKVITTVCNYIGKNITDEYIFVRYMGPKFAIVFSGVEVDGVVDFLNEKKEFIERMKISLNPPRPNQNGEQKQPNQPETKIEYAVPRLNFAISTYYKGTGLEEILKKLEEYLDTAPANENDINSI